ncbi:hypothetical protein KFL_007490090 [Klebsormidium nitens]|uniref:Uncharacterized protein n=1 Tax=Klebsormidium nitens TaxID=105231 RepID=A0A1Y1IK70_KLENI|nr:hypothetical protein KFL_007490090 [Klebsormidium nitens]|eukprot:GAQ91240.1 hypothetical protein KFL_007490090 [Klebsormidium nitens]
MSSLSAVRAGRLDVPGTFLLGLLLLLSLAVAQVVAIVAIGITTTTERHIEGHVGIEAFGACSTQLTAETMHGNTVSLGPTDTDELVSSVAEYALRSPKVLLVGGDSIAKLYNNGQTNSSGREEIICQRPGYLSLNHTGGPAQLPMRGIRGNRSLIVETTASLYTTFANCTLGSGRYETLAPSTPWSSLGPPMSETNEISHFWFWYGLVKGPQGGQVLELLGMDCSSYFYLAEKKRPKHANCSVMYSCNTTVSLTKEPLSISLLEGEQRQYTRNLLPSAPNGTVLTDLHGALGSFDNLLTNVSKWSKQYYLPGMGNAVIKTMLFPGRPYSLAIQEPEGLLAAMWAVQGIASRWQECKVEWGELPAGEDFLVLHVIPGVMGPIAAAFGVVAALLLIASLLLELTSKVNLPSHPELAVLAQSSEQCRVYMLGFSNARDKDWDRWTKEHVLHVHNEESATGAPQLALAIEGTRTRDTWVSHGPKDLYG